MNITRAQAVGGTDRKFQFVNAHLEQLAKFVYFLVFDALFNRLKLAFKIDKNFEVVL